MQHKQHKITEKEAKKLVDKLMTLRLDIWRAEMIRQIVGKKVSSSGTQFNLSLEIEISDLAILLAIDGGI